MNSRDSWLELAVAACDHAGLDNGSIETLVTWDQEYCANAVYRLDAKRYLKLFGPTAERQFHIERSVLRTLVDHPAIPAPRIVAAGEPPGGPPYLVLTAISGGTAEDVWESVPRTEQLTIARELGAITAAIHRLPQEDLAAVERQFGDRNEHIIKLQKARRIAEIEATETLSAQQRDDLLRFLHEEAPKHLNGAPNVTHSELAYNHIYLSRETGTWQVTGIIDWADAVLGPPEWDVVYLWHWTFTGVWHGTFTQDREAMQACLRTLFSEHDPPERFGRRCLAALLHTHSMSLLWPFFVAREGNGSKPIVRDMTEYFYPPDVFGPPD